MKTKLALLGLIAVLTSCVTTVTSSTLPDGTVVVVKARSGDPVAIKAALDAAALIQPTVDKIITQQQNPDTPSK
jgi:membrane protein involved in colicin uptake